jgi:hypothetical protein
VQGPWSGRLANSGGDLALDNEKETLAECSFQSGFPWPALTGGAGFSLSYRGGDPKLADAWIASAQIGGTPGQKNTLANEMQIRISEVLPGNWIELENTGKAEVDVSGWIIKESLADTLFWPIPAGTKVPGSGRVLVEYPDLSNTGETLYLIEMLQGVMTGSSFFIETPALEEGVSAGLVGESLEDLDIMPLFASTPALKNSVPRIGKLVISEIMYHPLDGFAEFLEVTNVTSDSLLLWDPMDFAAKWSVDGIDVDIPLGATIPANGKAVFVRDEDRDTAVFRQENQIPASVPVYSYAGKLSNQGETIRLKYPLYAVMNSLGEPSYAKGWSDVMTYGDQEPWSIAADGTGKSLVRADFAASGSDPKNWTASDPTPGR